MCFTEVKRIHCLRLGEYQGLPILWRLLEAKEEGFLLLLSQFCLEQKRFDEYSNRWEYSELRRWLNSNFYEVAFTLEEKSFMLPYEGDKVNLLSEEEIRKYFPSEPERQATFANDNRAWWWLRSNYPNTDNVVCVYYNGDICNSIINYTSGAVRPIIYLSKDVEKFLEPEEV